MRNGSFEYDGKINGYDPEGVKTNYPWKRSGEFGGPSDPSNPNFADVRPENGYYFLTIVDYDDPAPHNNIFIHYHRKVNMDAYNVNRSASAYQVTNPATGEKYGYTSDESTRNGINAIFMHGNKFKDSNMPYNEFIIETEAGTDIGNLVSAAEIQPELMPDEDYLFAIERTDNSYVMEISGNFLHAGDMTLRYEREFIAEDGRPIWHFNNRPDQYGGQYNQSWSDDGEYTIDETWPEGSAYPDYFILGKPHLNYYQGSATIDDIKLYTPELITPDYMKTIVWQLYVAEELNRETAEKLKVQLTEIENIKDEGDKEKLEVYITDFKEFINELKNNNLITEKAYKELTENTKSMI